ncbi:MAG: HAMP domain-containing protein [Acidimicrobiales bacterium]|nr:HAMP domain-containing protein [Acidimicrobiales bacterium]
MSKKLNLRNLLALIAIPPIVLLAFIAAYGATVTFLGTPSIDEIKTGVQVLSLVAVAGMLLSVGMVIVVGRRVLEPIKEVSEAAKELADVRLPLLIESLSNPGVSMPDFEPLAVSGETELAQLGDALNSLQNRAVTVANEQQRVVKEGISELVVNLARRNQSLLDRQIENIDNLESTEEDPDRLENLFRLDHLATRMRRNAESLLVLAGAEPSRRRGGPVVLADVVRVAMSEIEDYQHVAMGEIKTAHIGPQGAVDVAHLMSELLENATQFSPPDAPVEVFGGFDVNGFYEIVVRDHGIGMSAEQIANANATIQNPPELGLALTRSLGFQVIGRLSERLGVQVALGHTEGGGTTAAVRIPGSALSSGAAANIPAAFQPAPGATGAPTPRIAPAPAAAAAPAPTTFQPAPAAFESTSNPPAFQPAPFEAESAPAGFEPSPFEAQQAPAAFQPAPFEAESAPAGFETSPFEAQQAPAAFDPSPPRQPEPQEQFWADSPSQEAYQPEPAPQVFDLPHPAPQPFDQYEAAPTTDWHEAPAPQAFQPPAPQPAPAPQHAPAPQAFQPPAPQQAPAPQPAPAPQHAPAPQAFQPPAPQPAPAPQHAPAPQAFQPPAPQRAPAPQQQPDAGWATPPAPSASAPAPSMEHAMPTGAAFDQGVDALLDDPANRTSSGLVRRDRSQNHAPVSEGRAIPSAGAATAATASNRSPEEIRNMLARYRDGLKSRPDAGHGPN